MFANWKTRWREPWCWPKSRNSGEQDFILKSVVPNGGAKTLEDIEKAHILRILQQTGWNRTRAAQLLDIDRVTLHHKIKKYDWTKGRLRVSEGASIASDREDVA
jgi:DNA-binding NtrC family response regulator